MSVEASHRPEAGSQTAPDAAGDRSAGRRWPLRIVVVALLAVPMFVALGGTSQAGELDPVLEDTTQVVTESVDQVVAETTETVTDTVDPVVETVSETVDPVVETVSETVDPVVETVSETVDPVVETVSDTVGLQLETVGPVRETVDVVLQGTKGIGGGTEVDRLLPRPQDPSSRMSPPNPGSPAGRSGDPLEGPSFSTRGGAVGRAPAGAAGWPSTMHAPSSVGAEPRPADSHRHGPGGAASAPFGRSAGETPTTLLVLFAALAAALRVFRPSILSPIAPRAFALNGAAIALSVERPG